MNATEKETNREATSQAGETRGVPCIVLAKAEEDYRRAREIARLAVESYREARDKVTQLRKRRRAYEARQEAFTTGPPPTFQEFFNSQICSIARELGIPENRLRSHQATHSSTRARQIRDWSRHRPDPAAGEPDPAREV